ncbi:hypothetical protein ACPDHQ_17140, partial [Myroides odoratimimus]|uniref:hypothetical protein n=1 Tax=Myroides odoratimimus TaxID=76832 RepID=UPI003D2F7A7F
KTCFGLDFRWSLSTGMTWSLSPESTLCAEQYYWYKKGRISNEIWNAWHSGMMYYYNTFPVVKELWEEETKEEGFKSYYLKDKLGFFK